MLTVNQQKIINILKKHADDPKWHIRSGVPMQLIGSDGTYITIQSRTWTAIRASNELKCVLLEVRNGRQEHCYVHTSSHLESVSSIRARERADAEEKAREKEQKIRSEYIGSSLALKIADEIYGFDYEHPVFLAERIDKILKEENQ